MTCIEYYTYDSLSTHSRSGGMLIPNCGQAGQNIANEPGMKSVTRSWACPARIQLWRSRHSRETRRRSRYRSCAMQQSDHSVPQ